MSDEGIAAVTDGRNEYDGDIVTIDVGSLAVIVIIVVTVCFVMVMVGMCCWHHWSRSSPIRCDRCHNIVAYHGVRLPHLPPHLHTLLHFHVLSNESPPIGNFMEYMHGITKFQLF